MASPPASDSNAPRSSLVTILAIAVTAYALCDLAHEAVGHGLAALLVPDVHIISISTVALQTTGSSRLVAAAGSLANVVIGAIGLSVSRRGRRFSPAAYFAWLFSSLNLLNGSGYPLYSALLASGDWQVVIEGLQPPLLWRTALGLAGALAYTVAIVWSARALARCIGQDLVARAGIASLVFPAYFAGGALLLIAAVFNPISPSLVLLSGLSSGFGAMAGLTLVPYLVERQTGGRGNGTGIVPRSAPWIVTGSVVAALFIAILGPGLRF